MVKFSKELNAMITPEWRKLFIQYDRSDEGELEDRERVSNVMAGCKSVF
jgi:hypothetical protein